MNAEEFVRTMVIVVQVYLLLGLAFSVPFSFFFLHRVDPAAGGSSWAFRLIILPGLSIFWPLFVSRLVRQQGTPTESNAHRALAKPKTTKAGRPER